MDKLNINYNPDILNCLANLSNDEVFTPPQLANNMLDLLPNELWSNPNAKFLDPCCKTGVFLREIVKRLNKGLEHQIPDLQERINHILSKQIFGIGITELTSLMTKRTVYCSKISNGKYSVCELFDDEDGNIFYTRMEHKWKGDKCEICEANKDKYDRGLELETHAYAFIHKEREEIFNMKFDVIIGNPPYQLDDGGNGASAKPLYHKFVEQAKKMNPRYIVMIIPSRWFAGGKGLDEFRSTMLNDKRIRELHDFPNASECFPGVEIKGGVCYFLWDRDRKGLCNVCTYENNEVISSLKRYLLEDGLDVFIRQNEALTILKKVMEFNEEKFSSIVSSRKPFGLATNYTDFKNEKSDEYYIKVYAKNKKIGYEKIENINKGRELIDCWKLFIPEAIGSGNIKTDWVKPIIASPNTISTETYLAVGCCNDKKIIENIYSYTQTKFFHLLLGLRKITQHTTSKVYSFIPMQDFNESWNDEKLYKKYNLSQEEINFIESTVRSLDK